MAARVSSFSKLEKGVRLVLRRAHVCEGGVGVRGWWGSVGGVKFKRLLSIYFFFSF